MSRPSLFVAALLIATSSSAAGEMHVSGNTIIVDGRKVVGDPAGIDLASLSPHGKLIAYSQRLTVTARAIVIVRTDGTTLRTISMRDLPFNAVMELGWLDDRRVWIEGHETPDGGPFYVWDVESGKRIDERWGAWFTPSPDGRKIAQIEFVPHDPHAPTPHVLINGRDVYPSQGDPGRILNFVWSLDGSLLAFTESFDERQQVVVIRPDGRVRKRIKIEGQPIRNLSWSGRRNLSYSQDGVTRTRLVL